MVDSWVIQPTAMGRWHPPSPWSHVGDGPSDLWPDHDVAGERLDDLFGMQVEHLRGCGWASGQSVDGGELLRPSGGEEVVVGE